MTEATRTVNLIANKGQHCPATVMMAAAFVLLHAAGNIAYSCSICPITVLAVPAFLKGLLGIAVAIGLFRTKEGWRLFTLVFIGLSLPILPAVFLAVVLSFDFALFVSQLAGVDVWAVRLGPVAAFAIYGWMFRALLRPDVRRAFQSAL